MKYLITGLGNPTPEYYGTRHNVGFRMANHLAAQLKIEFRDDRYGAIAEGRIKNQQVVLLKPSTFMNLSGNAVRYWMQQLKTDLSHLLVLSDELMFDFGTIKLKPAGSAGGHNGLKHIAEQIGSQQYARIRFGVGNQFPRGKQVDYVLSPFSESEEAAMPLLLQRSTEMITAFVLSGVQHAMNQYNNHPVEI